MNIKINSTTKIVLILTILLFIILAIYICTLYISTNPEYNLPVFFTYITGFVFVLVPGGIGPFICIITAIWGFTGIFGKNGIFIDRIICIICTLLCLLSLICMLFPIGYSGGERTRRITCASNLKCCMLAFRQYAADYAGNYPSPGGAAGFEILRKYGYLTDYAIFTCPSTQTARGSGEQPLTEEVVDYVLVGDLNEKSDPKQPLMYDKANNHGCYGNVLFADGTEEGIFGNPWTQNLKK